MGTWYAIRCPLEVDIQLRVHAEGWDNLRGLLQGILKSRIVIKAQIMLQPDLHAHGW